MTNRLPIPGQDNNTWGTILNDFLEVSHNSDGTLASNTVGSSQIQAGSISSSKLDAQTQTNLTAASTAVQSVNGKTGTDITIDASDVSAIPSSQLGIASGVATLDSSSQLMASQLPSSVVSVAIMSGVVADGATDNYDAINAELARVSALGGGYTAQLPPGPVAVAQTIQIPENVILCGSGATNFENSNVYISDNGNTVTSFTTYLIPAPTQVGMVDVVNMSESFGGLQDLNVHGRRAGSPNGIASAGITTNALTLNAKGLTLRNVGVAGATDCTLNVTANAIQPVIDDVWVRTMNNTDYTTTAVNWLGNDGQVTNMVAFGGQFIANGPGTVYTNLHIVCNYIVTSGVCATPLVDAGNQTFVGLYVDGAFDGCTAMIDRTEATVSSLYASVQIVQSAPSFTGIPIIIESIHSGAGVTIDGMVLLARASGSTFSYLISGPLVSTILSNLNIPSGWLTEGLSDTVPFLGLYSNVNLGGVLLPNNAPHDATQQNDLLAWTYDPASSSSTSTVLPAATQIQLCRIPLPHAASITNILVNLTALGTTSLTHCFVAIFQSSGQFIAQSADQSASWLTGGTTGYKTIPLAGGPYEVQPLATNDFVWAAIYVGTAGGTLPAFGRSTNNASAVNIGTAITRSRYGTIAQADTTTLDSINPANIVEGAYSWWAAIN